MRNTCWNNTCNDCCLDWLCWGGSCNSNPELKVTWCATIDKSDSSEWIIDVPCISVVSPNWTIDVVKNWNVFEIEKECCGDNKVKASSTSTCNWYLQDVLKIDITSALTYTKKNPTWCEYMELWLDASKLSFPDEKVKFKSNCTADYLSNQIWVKTNSWLVYDSSTCKWLFWIDEDVFKKPIARRSLTEFQEFEMTAMWSASVPSIPATWTTTSADLTKWWMVLSEMDFNDNMSWLLDWWVANIFSPNALPAATIRIQKAWRYRVYMHWNCEYNWWVDSVNVMLWDSNENMHLISDEWEQNIAMMKSTKESWYNDDKYTQHFWHAAKDVYLEEWVRLYMWWRMSTDVWWPNEWWAWQTWRVRWRNAFYKFWTWFNTSINALVPSGGGNFFWVEWLTDANWSILYRGT